MVSRIREMTLPTGPGDEDACWASFAFLAIHYLAPPITEWDNVPCLNGRYGVGIGFVVTLIKILS